jgi:GxxExxY protein
MSWVLDFWKKFTTKLFLAELRKHGILCKSKVSIKVYYNFEEVGIYYADIVVDEKVIIEVKAGEGGIILAHELQLNNYLKATEYEVGLLLFFGEKPSFKRKIFTNDKKKIR